MPGQFRFLPPQFQADQDSVDRSRRLAEAMAVQGQTPLQGRQAGGYFIASSPLEGLAKVLQGFAGQKGMERAKEESAGIAGRASQERQQAIARALETAMGSPGAPQNTAGEGTGAFDMAGTQGPQMVGAQAPNPLAAYAQLAATGDPMALQTGGQMLAFQQRQQEGAENRAARMEEQAMRLEAQAAQFAQGSADRKAAEERAAALRREMQEAGFAQQRSMAQLAAGLRQPQQDQILQTAEGPMRLVGGKAVPITGPTGAPVKPPAGKGGPMTATAQKELIETEEQVQGGMSALDLFKQAKALNDKAMGFAGAGALANVGSLLPGAIRPDSVEATQNLDNILQTAALPQLKAIFGGMPTEGERKILLDVQGSSSKPANVRKEIFDRAEKAIEGRMKFSREKAKRLRDGTYFSGDSLPSITPAAPAAVQPSSGGYTDPEKERRYQEFLKNRGS